MAVNAAEFLRLGEFHRRVEDGMVQHLDEPNAIIAWEASQRLEKTVAERAAQVRNARRNVNGMLYFQGRAIPPETRMRVVDAIIECPLATDTYVRGLPSSGMCSAESICGTACRLRELRGPHDQRLPKYGRWLPHSLPTELQRPMQATSCLPRTGAGYEWFAFVLPRNWLRTSLKSPTETLFSIYRRYNTN
jgi:hypothetical protein